MSVDRFILTVGQAHELQHALSRNGWTSEQVHKLCEGDVLGRLRKYMFETPVLERSLYEIFTREATERQGIKHGGTSIPMILQNAGYITVRDLVQASERDIRNSPCIGEKYFGAIKGILADHGLQIGMVLPPSNQ